jgi:hypothetical protein
MVRMTEAKDELKGKMQTFKHVCLVCDVPCGNNCNIVKKEGLPLFSMNLRLRASQYPTDLPDGLKRFYSVPGFDSGDSLLLSPLEVEKIPLQKQSFTYCGEYTILYLYLLAQGIHPYELSEITIDEARLVRWFVYCLSAHEMVLLPPQEGVEYTRKAPQRCTKGGTKSIQQRPEDHGEQSAREALLFPTRSSFLAHLESALDAARCGSLGMDMDADMQQRLILPEDMRTTIDLQYDHIRWGLGCILRQNPQSIRIPSVSGAAEASAVPGPRQVDICTFHGSTASASANARHMWIARYDQQWFVAIPDALFGCLNNDDFKNIFRCIGISDNPNRQVAQVTLVRVQRLANSIYGILCLAHAQLIAMGMHPANIAKITFNEGLLLDWFYTCYSSGDHLVGLRARDYRVEGRREETLRVVFMRPKQGGGFTMTSHMESE